MPAAASPPGPALRAVIVDMDDTLYPERDYLMSGARTVAEFLAARGVRSAAELMDMIRGLLAEPAGREQLLDRLLRALSLWSPDLSATLVQVYRTHPPRIAPCSDVPAALARMRAAGLRLALLSDGPATVQRQKLAALGLASSFDALVFTDDLPPGNRKPSPIAFQVGLRLLEVSAVECACIADDGAKDFIAPRALGMTTVCVRRRLPYPLQPLDRFAPEQSADHVVEDLQAAAHWLLGPTRTQGD